MGYAAMNIKKTNSGKLIGNLYLGKRDFGALELGYVLNKHYWHQGYAKESCQAVIGQAFSAGVHRIYAQGDPIWKDTFVYSLLRNAQNLPIR